MFARVMKVTDAGTWEHLSPASVSRQPGVSMGVNLPSATRSGHFAALKTVRGWPQPEASLVQ